MESENIKAFERLKKFMSNTPNALYDNDGTLILDALFVILTQDVGFEKISHKPMKTENFLKLISKNTEKFHVLQLLKSRNMESKDFKKADLKTEGNYYLLLNGNILIHSNHHQVIVKYSRNINKEILNEVLDLMQQCVNKNKDKKNRFSMIVNGEYGNRLALRKFKLKAYNNNIDLHYNDDIKIVNETIISFLNEKGKNGLVLLHGKPGTGKTSYIRHIIKSIDKRVIYLPMHLMNVLSDPGFLEFMADYKDSVLILEDCEEILKPRQNNQTNNPSITNLLNLGDGLLSDALCIKVICTFNAEYQNIDKAILRKGRMVARYEFKDLNQNKAQALLNHLDKKFVATSAMNLADIYNVEEDNFNENIQHSKIGFVS